MVSIAEITASFRKAREKIAEEKVAKKNEPVLLLEEGKEEKLAKKKKFVFPKDKAEIIEKPVVGKKPILKLKLIKSIDIKSIDDEAVSNDKPVKEIISQEEKLPSDASVGASSIIEKDLNAKEVPTAEEALPRVLGNSSEMSVDEEKLTINKDKEQAIQKPELMKNEISEHAAEARRTVLKELEEKMQENRLKWLKVMEEKRRSYGKLYKFFGSRFKDNDQDSFQNDADISFYRGEYEKSLFEYKDAVLADAKIRGVSNQELGEVLKFFEIGLKLDTISAETQIKIETGSGNMKGPFTISQENSNWILSSDGKGVLQLPGSEIAAEIKKDEGVEVKKEEFAPIAERATEAVAEEVMAESVAPAEIVSEDMSPERERENINFQENGDFDHYFISAMKDISLENNDNWKAMRGKTYEMANEELKEDLFPGLMQNIVETVQKYQKEFGEDALPGNEEALNKWLGRVVKLSIERRLATKI